MPSPPFAIIIPCYNDGKYLPDALASVAACDPALYELIIVNDGSTDPETLQCLRQIEGEGFRVLNQENKGLAAARNAGIAATTAPYIMPLDSDNRLRPEYLNEALAVLESRPEVAVVYGDLEFFGSRAGRKNVPPPDFHHLLRSNYIDACAAFRRSLWRKIGGYDEMMRAGLEDWDFWIRAMSMDMIFVHIPRILFDYRVRSDSMSGDLAKIDIQQPVFTYIRSKTVPVSVGDLIQYTDRWTWLRDEFAKRPSRLLIVLRLWTKCVLARFFPRGRSSDQAKKSKVSS